MGENDLLSKQAEMEADIRSGVHIIHYEELQKLLGLQLLWALC